MAEQIVDTFLLFDLPPVPTLKGLASRLRLSPRLVYLVVFRPRYTAKTVSQPSGKRREIEIPSRPLKAIQRWVARQLLYKVPVDPHAFAYLPRTRGMTPAILRNAEVHSRNSHLMVLDLEDFFHSISVRRVNALFFSLGYRGHGLHLLTSVCTYKGRLPVGAPTSPAISNLVCKRLDRRLANFCERRGISYSRYSDDLTFSARRSEFLDQALPMIRKIVREEGFRENRRKYRRSRPGRRFRITGLTRGSRGFGIGRARYRLVRSMVWNAQGSPSPSLVGYLAFVKSVDSDRRAQLAQVEENAKKIGALLASRTNASAMPNC